MRHPLPTIAAHKHMAGHTSLLSCNTAMIFKEPQSCLPLCVLCNACNSSRSKQACALQMVVMTLLEVAGCFVYCGMFVWYCARAWLFLREQPYQGHRHTHQQLQLQVRPACTMLAARVLCLVQQLTRR